MPLTTPALRVDQALVLLRATRLLSTVAAVFLAGWLFGNLYEEIVTNIATIARPQVGALVGEFGPGSPFYYYVPLAPLGVVLVAVLTIRLRRLGAPTWVVRRPARLGDRGPVRRAQRIVGSARRPAGTGRRPSQAAATGARRGPARLCSVTSSCSPR